jgi:hypothetical protein
MTSQKARLTFFPEVTRQQAFQCQLQGNMHIEISFKVVNFVFQLTKYFDTNQ